MQPVSELVVRNLPRIAGDHELLLLNAPADGLAAALAPHVRQLVCSTRRRGTARALEASRSDSVTVRFEALPRAPQSGPAVLLAPREKDLFEFQADALRPLLGGHPLWIVGEKRAGVRSAVQRLKGLYQAVELKDTARHGALFEARSPSPEAFDRGRYAIRWPLTRDGRTLTVASWPGVFAHGGLDEGTALLLDALDTLEPAGRVLDFACGAGVVGAALAQRHSSIQLELCDHDALALDAAAATLSANGIEANIIASDGLDEVPGPFDWIVSNPPFHQGVRTDFTVAERFIAQAPNRLKPDGRLVLVANRHLPYRRWLDRAFGGHEEIAANARFVVLSAHRDTRRPRA